MASDVVDILSKGRLPLRAVRASLRAERNIADPRHLVSARLHFVIAGEIPDDRIERAIALSRERYCSVLHSLRADLAFDTSFERHA
jgi:putative redox protein